MGKTQASLIKVKCTNCNRQKLKNDHLCQKCAYKRRLKNDPEKLHWWILRGNAKRRGKDCTITLEEFRSFCKENNYIELCGTGRLNMSIDRIDSSRGYSKDNIRMITNLQNIRKQHIEAKIRKHCSSITYEDIERLPPLQHVAEPITKAPF